MQSTGIAVERVMNRIGNFCGCEGDEHELA